MAMDVAFVLFALIFVLILLILMAAILLDTGEPVAGAMFSGRCAAVVNAWGYGYPLVNVSLNQRSIVVARPFGRVILPYEDVDDIVDRRSIESLYGPLWWRTLQIKHHNAEAPGQVYLLMSRRKAETVLGIVREMKSRHLVENEKKPV